MKFFHSLFDHSFEADDFWLKRLHTLALSSNGAAIIFLGTFVTRQSDPFEYLSRVWEYFFSFGIGLVFAVVANLIGMALVHKKDWGRILKIQADTKAEKFTINPEFAEAHFRNGDEVLTGNEEWERDISAFNATTISIHNLFKSFLFVIFVSLASFSGGIIYLFV